MKTITDRLNKITQSLPKNIKLIAVSKKQPLEFINEAYKQGQKDFGENRALELKEKASQLPKDIKWHMIGHLQTNKVKYIAPFINLIHSVDSLKLLKEINKRALENKRTIKCLLQIRIAKELAKFGISYDNAVSILKEEKLFSNVQIIGIMGMATFTKKNYEIEKEFKYLGKIYKELRKDYPKIHILSMGMSQDYKIAIKEGSNMIRLGSTIFGKRSK